METIKSLKENVEIILPTDGLEEKLKLAEAEKRGLVIKLGLDPTARDLHLGHAVVLKKIRQALLKKKENPHPDFEDSPLYADEETPLDETFARELTKSSAHFVYCDGEINMVENLILLIEKLKVTKIAAWESSIQKTLNTYSFPHQSTDENIEAIEVGITGCEF